MQIILLMQSYRYKFDFEEIYFLVPIFSKKMNTSAKLKFTKHRNIMIKDYRF